MERAGMGGGIGSIPSSWMFAVARRDDGEWDWWESHTFPGRASLADVLAVSASSSAVRSSDEWQVLESLTSLVRLRLSEYGDPKPLSGEDLRNLPALPALRRLSLVHTGISDDDLELIPATVTSLDLEGAEVNGEGLRHLHGVTELGLSHLGLRNKHIEHLRRLTSLTRLELEGNQLTKRILPLLGELEALEVLNLTNLARELEGDLEHLGRLTNLKRLLLGNVRGLSGAGLAPLAKLGGLRELDLNNTDVDDESLVHLSDLGYLERLDLTLTPITSEGLRHLAGLITLVDLDLSHTELDGAALEHLRGLTSLKRLNLSNCANLTDDGFEHLNDLSSLEELALDHTVVSGSGLQFLTAAPLRHLDLGNTPLEDEALESVGQMVTVEQLNLEQTHVSDEGLRHLETLERLLDLDLAGTTTGNSGLAHLGACTVIEDLTLRRTRVTAEGLRHLAGLSLRKLDLRGTWITPEDLTRAGVTTEDSYFTEWPEDAREARGLVEEVLGLPVRNYAYAPALDPAEHAYRLASARIGPDFDVVDLLERLCDEPAAARVRALVFGMWQTWKDGQRRDLEPVVEALVAHRDRLPNLVALALGDVPPDSTPIQLVPLHDVSPVLKAFPALEYLSVRGNDHWELLGDDEEQLRHAALRTLILDTHELSGSLVRQVVAAHLPELEHLELGHTHLHYGPRTEDLVPVLSGKAFPALRHLGLRMRDPQYLTEIVQALAMAPLLQKLDVLELSGDLWQRGAQALLGSPAIHDLQRLAIRDHSINDPEVLTRLRGLEEVEVEITDPTPQED